MRYLLDNKLKGAIATASNESTNYPASNLLDPFLERRFQSTAEISVAKLIMEAAADVNAIAHGFTNAESINSQFYRSSQFIGVERTNLVQDPTDLTTGNWANSNSTDELSALSINGNLFTKVTNVGANIGWVEQNFTAPFTNLILTGQVILKKGSSSGNTTQFRIRNNTNLDFIFRLPIDWDNFGSVPGVIVNGVLLDYKWYDSETLLINFECDPLDNLTDDVELRCFGSDNSTDGEYTYWTEVQLIDEAEITMFPFVDGTHSADVIDETQTLPDKCTIDMIIEPRFAYDNTINQSVAVWRIDQFHTLSIIYAVGTDIIKVNYTDGGINRSLNGPIFDDGTSFINVNQRIRIIGSFDLVSGGINDSRFIVIPLESGTLSEDTSWNGAPDVKTSIFPTLSIGNTSGVQQSNSVWESLRIYEGLLVGTVNSSDDADALLADRTPVFEFEPDDHSIITTVDHDLDTDPDITYFDTIENVSRIDVTIQGPDPVYLGGLSLDTYLQLPDPLADFGRPLEDNTFVQASPSGQVLSNYERPLRAHSWSFRDLLLASANELRDNYIALGKGAPFYADFFEEAPELAEPLYCYFTGPPGDQKNGRRIDYTIELLEAR